MLGRNLRIPALVMLCIAAISVSACRDDDDDGGSKGGADAGAPAKAPGFDGRTITVGAITPTSGPVAASAKLVTSGNTAYFDDLNANGGVAGKYKVDVAVQDSKYDPATAVQAYGASKANTSLYVQVFGTAITNALGEQLETDGIVVLPAAFDGLFVRNQQLLPVGTTYEVQAINAVDYMVNQRDSEGKRFCSVLQDDSLGEAVKRGLDFVYDKLGVTHGVEVKVSPANPDVTAQVTQLRKDGCEVVVIGTTGAPSGAVLGKAAELGFDTKWVGIAASWVAALAQSPAKDYIVDNYLLVSDGTSWGDSDAPGMADLVEIHDKYAPDVSPEFGFGFGYAQAMATHEVLEKAVELGDLSREGIVEAMNSLSELDYGGISPTWSWGSPEERQPPTQNTVFEPAPSEPDALKVLEFQFEGEVTADYEF